jgi:folate-dependent phosphoribosylglycinamide formyltransferase PurN
MFEHTIAAIEDGSLDAEIGVVFMHREHGEGEVSDAFINLVQSRRIPIVSLSSKRFRAERGGTFSDHREDYDKRVLDLIRPFSPDLCVLAGYLLILSPQLVQTYPFINLHPSLPGGPIGLWQRVMWQLIEDRAAQTGAMTLLVTEDLDGGPPLTYARTPLVGPPFDNLWADLEGETSSVIKMTQGEEHPLFKAIRRAELAIEAPLLTETLRLLEDGELALIEASRGEPLDLTDRIISDQWRQQAR